MPGPCAPPARPPAARPQRRGVESCCKFPARRRPAARPRRGVNSRSYCNIHPSTQHKHIIPSHMLHSTRHPYHAPHKSARHTHVTQTITAHIPHAHIIHHTYCIMQSTRHIPPAASGGNKMQQQAAAHTTTTARPPAARRKFPLVDSRPVAASHTTLTMKSQHNITYAHTDSICHA